MYLCNRVYLCNHCHLLGMCVCERERQEGSDREKEEKEGNLCEKVRRAAGLDIFW